MDNIKLPLLDAIKQGILLERKGKIFYEIASKQAEDKLVKDFFQEMSDDEFYHDRYLSKIYSNLNRSGIISKIDLTGSDIRKASRVVINNDLITKISSASYEAAAISAAIELEKKSIQLYSAQADNSTDSEEKNMFEFLRDWEKGHLDVLENINRELQDKVWFDNNFWPF